MVVSKRCKICAVLDADNIPISGEYFGKTIPILVEKISGVELDERKINGVLICLHCVIELVHTDVVIDKLRNSVQRLKKTGRQTKPKTPSKEATKKSSDNVQEDKRELINGTINEESPIEGNYVAKFQKINDDTKATLDDTILKSNNKVARRKSVFPDDKLHNTLEDTTPVKKTAKKDSKRKLKSFEDSVDSSIVDNNATKEGDVSVSKPKKRSKTIAATLDHDLMDFDHDLMDLTSDEQDLNNTNAEEPSEKATKTKVHNCVLCIKSFNQKSALRDHIDACHMGERLKECPHCSMEFRSMQKYESHVFNEKCKNTLHPCQYPKCNKRFKTVHKMELHMQEKHSSQNGSETD